MVFKEKITSSGKLEKLKARFCARGDMEKDIPGEDNWSSCVSQRTVRMFLAHATKEKRTVLQLDFIGSYLQARMRARMFIKLQPELAKFFPDLSEYFFKALLLNKTLYGLTEAAKFWNTELTQWLKNNTFGFFHNPQKIQAYISGMMEKDHGFILFFMLMMDYITETVRKQKKFFNALSSNFNVESKGYAHWFLGMRINRHCDGSYTIDHYRFVSEYHYQILSQ